MTNDQYFKDTLEKIKNSSMKSRIMFATKTVVRFSVSAVVAKFIKTYCPTENKKQELELTIASWALGGLIADGATTWATNKVAHDIEFVQTAIKKSQESKKTEETWKEATTE